MFFHVFISNYLKSFEVKAKGGQLQGDPKEQNLQIYKYFN